MTSTTLGDSMMTSTTLAHKTTNITETTIRAVRVVENKPTTKGRQNPNQRANVNFPFSYILSSFINSEVPQRRNTQ